jgi:PTH1 family peptidyl-tRNA hydrolase
MRAYPETTVSAISRCLEWLQQAGEIPRQMNTPYETSQTFLIVGLGNPGRQYRENRHNVGFVVVDWLTERLSAPGLSQPHRRVQFRALVTDTRYEGRRVLLAKPQTYMNESGVAVGALLKFYKVPLTNFLVAHDDVDLPFATLRLRPGGGSAGQKGVASIIEKLGTQDFPRLRLGIGRPPGQMLAAAYVLQDFTRHEIGQLPTVLERAADAALVFVLEGLDAAMNRYNGQAIEEEV